MSTEASSHQPDRSNVRSLDAKRVEAEGAEVVDFSEIGVERVTGSFLGQLRHPSRAKLHGEELAFFIDTQLNPSPATPSKTLEARLQAIVDSVDIADIHDAKMKSDLIYKALVFIQMNTNSPQDARRLKAQRHANMSLMKLRAANPVNMTKDDDTWSQVIDRLFH